MNGVGNCLNNMENNVNDKLIEAAWSPDGTCEELGALLSKEKCFINLQFPPHGYTLMHYAARGDWVEEYDGRFKLLLSYHPDLEIRSYPCRDWRDGLDWTVLMVATWFGTLDKVRMLIDAGADVNSCDLRGMTPLMLAQYSWDADVRSEVLIQGGAQTEQYDKEGWNASRHLSYVKSLISEGP